MTDNKELNPIDEIKEEELEYKKDDKEKDEEEKKNEDETKKEETSENEENTDDEDEDKKKNKYSLENQEEETKTEYSLDDIPEYVELKSQYATLEEKYNSLVKSTEDLTSSLTSLQEFKKVAERKDKENLIAQFYMLSDEDKEDVQKNIDTYSLDEIESKLSVLCFRKKVNLNNDITREKEEEKPEVLTYNINDSEDVTVPAWVKAVAATQEKM